MRKNQVLFMLDESFVHLSFDVKSAQRWKIASEIIDCSNKRQLFQPYDERAQK